MSTYCKQGTTDAVIDLLRGYSTFGKPDVCEHPLEVRRKLWLDCDLLLCVAEAEPDESSSSVNIELQKLQNEIRAACVQAQPIIESLRKGSAQPEKVMGTLRELTHLMDRVSVLILNFEVAPAIV